MMIATGMGSRVFKALCCAFCFVAVSACGQAKSSGPADRPSVEDEVSYGYGTESRATSTASISSITSEEISGMRVSHVEELLRGRLAGVDVIRLGNGDFTVRIRGSSSLMGSNEPLYVIDGMPIRATGFMNALSGIAPQDIRRIDILKDAGSLAMYGSRGANGVVLITTRRTR
jgi:TonB-dependent starch-binding outer membrane protein SusC